jgi:hypothetical protein
MQMVKMGEYKPTEKELINELCNARECDWKAAALEWKKWQQQGCDDYGAFVTEQAKGNIPIHRHLLSAVVLRGRESFSYIIDQFHKCTVRERDLIINDVYLYRKAARMKLNDIAQTELLRTELATKKWTR